jgi:hypothetical protein
VSLHRQLKTKLALSLAFQGYSPTQKHYTNQSKQGGKKKTEEPMQQIKTFFHTQQGVLM